MVPFLPYSLQLPPNEEVESSKCCNRDQERDEERADHVVAKEVPQRVSRRDVVDCLFPVGGVRKVSRRAIGRPGYNTAYVVCVYFV